MSHRQKHTLNDTNNHTGISGSENNLITLDSNGLPQDGSYAVADIDMQLAYDNDEAIVFSKAMSWDLNEAYTFSIREGTDYIEFAASAANTLNTTFEVAVLDINTSGAMSLSSASTAVLETTGGSTLTLTASGGAKATVDIDADFDVNIDTGNRFSVGGAATTKNVSLVADAGGVGNFSLELNSEAGYGGISGIGDTGSDVTTQILAAHTGGASGDDAFIDIVATASGSGVSGVYVGRDEGDISLTQGVHIDASGVVNIGTGHAPVIMLGQSASSSELHFVDENHNGSTWSQGYIPLSDAQADWNTFETNFGEVSLMTAINTAYTGSTLWTTSGATNLTPSTAGYGLDIDATGTSTVELNAAAASHFTVAGAGLTLSTTTSGDIDISAAANLDLDGATVNINSTGTLAIGDDTATLNFDGAGAVTETGMVTFSITPTGAITMTGGNGTSYSMAASSGSDISMTIGATNSGLGNAHILIDAGGDVRFDDLNRVASTWTQTYIPLSDSTSDWDTFETNFGEVSLMTAINAAYTGSTLWTTSGATNLTPATAGYGLDIDATGTSTVELNAAAASHFTVAGAGLTLSTTTSGDIDISSAADLDLDGATVNINSTGVLLVGDDTGNLQFNGSGAVTESGITDFTITTSNTLTMQSATGTATFGDSTAQLEFNGSGGFRELGMTTCNLSPSGAVTLTGGDNSTVSIDTNDAGDKTLTISAANVGAGDGLISMVADEITIGSSGATTISVNSNKITNVVAGTANTDAVNVAQLNNAINGLSWQEPVAVLRIKSDADQSGADPTAGSTGEAWLVNNWLNETDGDIVEWDGAAWQVIVANSGGEPPDGTRVAVISSGAAGSFATYENDIGVYDATGNSWSFTTAANGMAVLVDGDGGVYENTGWTYDDTPGNWVQFSGASLYTAGSGIDISSQVISLGALTTDWAAGNYNITGLAYVEMDELKLAVVAQAAQPTPTSGTAVFWRDTDDSNAIYLVFNDPTAGVVTVELT